MDDEWADLAKKLLRGEMGRRGVTYKALAEKLTDGPEIENEANLRNKVSRGGFSAAFFLQAMKVMGCQTIRLSDD